MKIIRLISILTLSLTLVLSVEGQQAETKMVAVLGPIPFMTAGADISNSQQYVFWGPKISQLTISYPADFVTHAGPRQVYTVSMLNQVQPIVSTLVNEMPDGTFEYVYSIRNAADAKDAIRVLSLALPATDALKKITAGSWSAVSEAAPGHEVPLEGAASMTPVIFAVLRDAKGTGITPGGIVTDIKIRSAYRPGLTLLYSRSGEDYDVPSDVPTRVREQLAIMSAPEWKNHQTIVIGPVYPSVFPRDFVANEFRYGVARLSNAGELQESSPAVAALTRYLDAVSRSGGLNVSIDELQSISKTPSESALINAAILSLR